MSQKLEVLEQVNDLTLKRGSNPFFPTQDFVLLPIYLMVCDHWCVTFLNTQDMWMDSDTSLICHEITFLPLPSTLDFMLIHTLIQNEIYLKFNYGIGLLTKILPWLSLLPLNQYAWSLSNLKEADMSAIIFSHITFCIFTKY